jgi:hypothetical protein
MFRKLPGPAFVVAALIVVFVMANRAASQKLDSQPTKPQPKAEPVAETRLLMEALAHPNFRGLEKILRQKPKDSEAWTFARGQALLIAETGNLLLLRPPRTVKAQPAWFTLATDLRSTARDLAKSAAERNFEGSRAGFVRVANACNRCHQSFRIPVDIVPFEEAAPKKSDKQKE